MKSGCWKVDSICLIFILFFIFTMNSPVRVSSVRLELIHRHSFPSPGLNQEGLRMKRLREMVGSDILRQSMISHRQRHRGDNEGTIRRKATAVAVGGNVSSIELGIHAGADYGIGQYIVEMRIGNPPQRLKLIADTGSDLTWAKCRYRCGTTSRCGRPPAVFLDADRSKSFKAVDCSSPMCKDELSNLFSLDRCPSPATPCAFDYRYSDGSAALGFFAKETVTVGVGNGKQTELPNTLIGCSDTLQGQSFQGADGVIGLGYSNYSFAIKAAKSFGNKFSYCLVDHLSPQNLSSYLTFGCHPHDKIGEKPNVMQYTELVLGVINPFYAVKMRGISVGGVMMRIPAQVWDINGVGGAIVDSGSSLTFLALPAYRPVIEALKASLVRFKKLELDIGPMEYCFNSSGFYEARVPRLGFHFEDGAKFEPPVKSYIIDVADGVKCIGLAPTTWPGTSVIGNIMQQNHLWEFDLSRRKVGFAPSACT